MSEELKPCPFCGGAASYLEIEEELCQPRCGKCGVTLEDGDHGIGWYAGHEEAARAWNRRAQPAEAEGIAVVGVVCISHFKNNPAMENVEFHLAADLPQGQHEVILHSSHLAALSAVTAERDRLLSESSASRDALVAMSASCDQLRAEVEASRLLLEQCNEVIAEDGGVYIELRAFLAGTMPASDVIALLRGAAMAAKEA